jgi:hypothetical protein
LFDKLWTVEDDERASALPLIGRDLYAGNGVLMFWSHQALHPWQTRAWIEQQRRDLHSDRFRRMFLNEFTNPKSAFLTSEQIDKCTSPSVVRAPVGPNMPIDVAVDASWNRDQSAIMAVYGEGTRVRTIDHRIFEPPIEFEAIEDYPFDLARRYKIIQVLFDPTQMIATAQRLTARGINMKEFTQTPSNLSSMTQNLFDLIHDGRLTMYPDEQLRAALLDTHAIETRTGGVHFTKNRRKASTNDIV